MLSSKQLFRRIAVLAVILAVSVSGVRAAEVAPQEQELLAVLQSDAPKSEKALVCKKLAIHGSSAAVPELAKLLPDPQLSSWARIALEAIPGSESDAAFRSAAGSLDGLLLVGTINSIGVRRDAGAVDLLTGRLQHKDPEVAAAAAVALGRIGNADATKTLRLALSTAPASVRSAVAEGCVLCAERLLAGGQSADAAALYDEVRGAEVPQQRIIEATRGAILARGAEGLPLLLEQLRSNEKAFFQLALQTARELPGSDVDKALAAELGRAQPARAALIVYTMADRSDTVVLPAILQSAASDSRDVRLAALSALRRVGDASCLSTLLDSAVDSDGDVAQTARLALAKLPGEKIDAKIVAMLGEAGGKTYPLLIELTGQRRIDAVPQLLKAVEHSDAAVRHAALIALGETVSLQRLSVLISQALAPKHREDGAVALQALKVASVRMPDRDACAQELTKALQRSPSATKEALLEILTEVGGATALKTLGDAASSSDPLLQDAGSRLLGKWNSVDAAPVLLKLAKTAPDNKYKVRALRGYLGLARKFAMPEPQRVEMCRNAVDAALRVDEQKLALDVLQLRPSPEGLNLAVQMKQTPALKEAATAATLVIAQKLGGKGVDVQKLLAGAGLDPVKLEIVKAVYGSGAKQKDVTDAVRKHAGNLPLITLASSSYNASFGGDPAPGVVKQLKIEYRINGKAGEAAFAENDLIILPMPN